MQYQDFTEMPVWQQASNVIQITYKLCAGFPKSEEYALASQMKRAAVSIAANVAEAFGRNHTKDKINFYLFARGSSFELRSHLLIANQLGFINADQIQQPGALCREIIFALNKIIKGLGTPS